MDLAAIIINHRTADRTAEVASALLPELAAAGTFHLYIVDDDSRDGSREALRAYAIREGWGDRVTVVAAPSPGGGYGHAVNVAIDLARVSVDPPDHFYLLPADNLADPGSVRTLLAFMRAHPEAGLCGSNIRGPGGDSQSAAFRFPTPASELNDMAKSALVSRMVSGRSSALPLPPELLTEAEWISGTGTLIRRTVFEQIGAFDEGFVHFFAEADFCKRAHGAGWKLYCLPSATVTRTGSAPGSAPGAADSSSRTPRHWFESRHRYFIKHQGRSYAGLSDLAWLAGFALGETKNALLRRPSANAPHLLPDFVRATVSHLTDPRLPGPVPTKTPAVLARGELPPAAPVDRRTAAEVSTLELLAEDFATYDHNLAEAGLWAVVTHRLGTRAQRVQSPPARAALQATYKAMFTGIDWILGIHLPRSVELGRRVRLWHNGCMLLTARSIGDDVHIRHDTTFGPLRGAQHGPETLPVIEDRADIGSGACVLGGVRVGHDAVVGANTVVLKTVPPHATVLGVPARIVPT